jgi:hypothetical protein
MGVVWDNRTASGVVDLTAFQKAGWTKKKLIHG